METVLISFIRSFQPSIKRQMIMLPLHGQGTAAVEKITGQDEPLIKSQEAMFLVNSRTNVCKVPS